MFVLVKKRSVSRLLKSILKHPIWKFHWKRDAATHTNEKTPFEIVYLQCHSPPTVPFKVQYLINALDPNTLSRSALSSVLRFWTTPARLRMCSCGKETSDLVNHLLLECRLTRDLIFCYIPTLPCTLAKLLKPGILNQFFLEIAKSKVLLENFNEMIGQFDIPRY